jgi:alkanesulfonate monooxygenase SsuD/methylene tetrahydromethanopterin reductase-like flavin-dependent oxidoreductase (luciferase family)
MRVGVVFSQADSGTDPEAIRRWATTAEAAGFDHILAYDHVLRRVVRKADGWMPLLIPGLDPISVADGVRRLRELCEDAGREPATLPIHGRVYVGDGWQSRVDEAVGLGFSDLSVGFNRLANPGRPHDEHLAEVIVVKAEVDRLVS